MESKLLKTRLVEAGLQAKVEKLEAELERFGKIGDENNRRFNSGHNRAAFTFF